ncbi:MAG: hypothetical protein ABSH56_02770 [Bryobacteraceae bacterium]|jgi:hypothetical protein
MGSVSSINAGVSDLLQTLSSLGSPIVSSSATVSALEKASPGDLVQLSRAAIQLENVDEMFGGTTGSSAETSATSLEDVLAQATESSPSSGASSSATASSTATTAAQIQSAEIQGLLDSGASGGLTGSLFDEIG